jgi:hypothetical protein
MKETIAYYFQVFLSLCGELFTGYTSIFELAIVLLAFLVVVYAFYKAITLSLWPGETSKNHIKRTVLEDDFGDHS